MYESTDIEFIRGTKNSAMIVRGINNNVISTFIVCVTALLLLMNDFDLLTSILLLKCR